MTLMQVGMKLFLRIELTSNSLDMLDEFCSFILENTGKTFHIIFLGDWFHLLQFFGSAIFIYFNNDLFPHLISNCSFKRLSDFFGDGVSIIVFDKNMRVY